MRIEEQERVLNNDKKNMLVSASAGSGKTCVVIKYITKLICENRVPVKDFVILTFTKAAATEMKERLQKSLKQLGDDPFIVEQLDALSIANISTIHAFCEKCLKKYANLIDLNSNFEIADENQTKRINQEAFENSLKLFSETDPEGFLELMRLYKNNKAQIREILFDIETLVSAVADRELFIQENINNAEKFFDRALEYLFKSTKEDLNTLLAEVEKLHVDDFEFSLRSALSGILSSRDLLELSKAISDFKFPFLPKKKDVGEECVEALNKIKKNLNKTLEDIANLNLEDKDNIESQRASKLENILLRLFLVYSEETQKLKKLQNVLSFGDLERYMEILTERENLFDDVKYVFIDEYQDTNKIQEKIVKNVAKNGNFVAVGDVKQGIYGFRLASCEIFLKDMKQFEEDEDSTLNLLKKNFRSSQRVLNFVNDVFKVCMTENSAGINYVETAMLEGITPFEKESARAVNIDIVREDKYEEEKLPEVYSVKADALREMASNRKQLLAVKNRILEVLKSEVFENGEFRKCRFSDIAILLRSRSGGLFDELEEFLLESGIPVISNSRNSLFDEIEMNVLLNWLKLALNLNDDIALLSVLKSPLVGFSLEELASILKYEQSSLCDIVKTNTVFAGFLKLLEDFNFDCTVFGIRVAFCKLFDKTNYFAYINSLKKQQRLNAFLDKFLATISDSGFEFDIAGLLNFFETVEITVVNQTTDGEEAVTLTTIHNSKGLEYPIVFLCGCDKGLRSVASKGLVEINEAFGFSVKQYDAEKNQELLSVKMKAIKDSERKKDFIEELMIFYVALTRAKNRLYLFGRFSDQMLKRYSLWDCNSYLDLIFFSLPNMRDEFVESGRFVSEDMEINLIDEIDELSLKKVQLREEIGFDDSVARKLREYLEYQYKFNDRLNFKLKESVTSLNKRQLEDLTEHYSNESFNFGGSTVEEGNAYHLALKLLDFDKIENEADLEVELKNCEDALIGKELLDKSILLKNILLLKNFTKGAQVLKEKQFIMKEKLCNLLEKIDCDDEILVQGIIDFYVIKDGKIILIDYKYSQIKNDEKLIEKYKNQLKLYKLALINAFGLPVEKTYLLSLKYAKLIEINI